MLLVSAEKRGFVSRPVGGGSAAEGSIRSPQQQQRIPNMRSPNLVSVGKAQSWGSNAPPPVELEAGEVFREIIKLDAGAKSAQQYVLQSDEYVSWECVVSDGYTVDFSVKVCAKRATSEVQCVGRPLKLIGVNNSRVVSEVRRGASFHGYLDLAGEHAECCSSNAATVLVVEIDNGFSYFRQKEVVLRVSKRGSSSKSGAECDESKVLDESSEPAAAAEETPDLPLAPQESSEEPEPNGMCDSVHTSAETPPPASSPPSSEVPSPKSTPPPRVSFLQRGSAGSSSCLAEDARLSRLRSLLKEAVRLCPQDASAARDHLLQAQARIEEYAEEVREEDLGPLS
eukprot:TRINITY_DN63379_c0_g1_i1.p1 TRINITY_DN63379_c0_g1~~TRINITY_DN63379_c0_g1_i1.p1  ORF type:complete len:341 (+),score=72.65 TRINITY_DN63379_c0_g1_i1:99-1121(+)